MYNPSIVGQKLENQEFKVIPSYRGNSRLTWAIETLSHKNKEMKINKASLADGPPRVFNVVKKKNKRELWVQKALICKDTDK